MAEAEAFVTGVAGLKVTEWCGGPLGDVWDWSCRCRGMAISDLWTMTRLQPCGTQSAASRVSHQPSSLQTWTLILSTLHPTLTAPRHFPLPPLNCLQSSLYLLSGPPVTSFMAVEGCGQVLTVCGAAEAFGAAEQLRCAMLSCQVLGMVQ